MSQEHVEEHTTERRPTEQIQPVRILTWRPLGALLGLLWFSGPARAEPVDTSSPACFLGPAEMNAPVLAEGALHFCNYPTEPGAAEFCWRFDLATKHFAGWRAFSSPAPEQEKPLSDAHLLKQFGVPKSAIKKRAALSLSPTKSLLAITSEGTVTVFSSQGKVAGRIERWRRPDAETPSDLRAIPGRFYARWVGGSLIVCEKDVSFARCGLYEPSGRLLRELGPVAEAYHFMTPDQLALVSADDTIMIIQPQGVARDLDISKFIEQAEPDLVPLTAIAGDVEGTMYVFFTDGRLLEFRREAAPISYQLPLCQKVPGTLRPNAYAVVAATGRDSQEATALLDKYRKLGLPRHEDYPRIVESRSVVGMEPGQWLVLAAAPKNEQVAKTLAEYLAEQIPGAYFRPVLTPDAEDLQLVVVNSVKNNLDDEPELAWSLLLESHGDLSFNSCVNASANCFYVHEASTVLAKNPRTTRIALPFVGGKGKRGMLWVRRPEIIQCSVSIPGRANFAEFRFTKDVTTIAHATLSCEVGGGE